MATKKQKEELIDILKFTPHTVSLSITGYGGETYAGRVDRETYEFFKKNQYDIEEYAGDWDGEWNDRVPEEHQMFSPGSPYDCDGLWHASGAELSDSNQLTVSNASGVEIWSHNLGFTDLVKSGVTVNEIAGCETADLDTGTVVFWGGNGEKGCFFDAEFTLTAPFDPKKLVINYENCDDWYIVTGVEYDGEELEGCDGYSTTGKWTEHKWVIVGDEEVYEPISIDDREQEDFDPATELEKIAVPEGISEWPEVLEGEETQAQEAIDNYNTTEWFDISVKPVHKGEYECQFESATWPFPIQGMCEWTGRIWKCNGEKATGIKQWRGLKEPNES